MNPCPHRTWGSVSSPCRLHRDSYGASVGAWCGISPPRSSGGWGSVPLGTAPLLHDVGGSLGGEGICPPALFRGIPPIAAK